MNALLTIVIVNYNQGIYFADCFHHIENQSFKDFELIVIDDCSTDHSVQQINEILSHSNLPHQFIVNQINQGICANLNMALKQANGTYFAFIASDDWLETNFYERMIAAIHNGNEKLAAVYSDSLIVDVEKKELYPSFIRFHQPGLLHPPSGEIYRLLLQSNFIPAMAAVTKKEVFLSLGGFDEQLKLEDYDMWLRVARQWHINFVPGTHAYYRVVSNSLIRTLGARKYEDTINMYLKHVDNKGPEYAIISKNLSSCCEFLYYTDSDKLDYYLQKCKPHLTNKLKLSILRLFHQLNIKGSQLKRWSNFLQNRKTS